jgi:L-threonylcarbamoyladenylate synthase
MEVFHTDRISENDFNTILAVLRRGGVIGFPTDTAYGLGADPFNESAIKRIFEIKKREETKPILLLVDSIRMTESVSRPPIVFYRLARQFWPGPLTVILPASPLLSAKVTAATGTIGLRWPAAEFATSLVTRFGRPITATSANRSNMASAVTCDEVRSQLGTSLDVLIDGGMLPARGGSSLLDLVSDPPVLLREGPVSFESLSEFFGGNIRRQVA